MNGSVRNVFGDVSPEALRRVLLVRLDNLGDVLLMTPAFRAVRRALPGRTWPSWPGRRAARSAASTRT